MAAGWEERLERWVEAALIDAGTAERIRAFEASHAGGGWWGWAARVALAFGVLTLGAGILLFIAAHWDELAPSSRFLMVLCAVGAFHVAGAFAARRSENLAISLHVVGTIALGGGIFLTAQIFNLQEHWPAGLLLWAVGAWLAWLIRRDWPQAALAALLTPAWLAGEWAVRVEHAGGSSLRILTSGLLFLALTYFSLGTDDRRNYLRRSVSLMGGVAVIPFAFGLVMAGYYPGDLWRTHTVLSPGLEAIGWSVAFGAPLALAAAFRGKKVVLNLAAAAWVWVLGVVSIRSASAGIFQYAVQTLGPYVLCGLGAAGLVVWGIAESRRERINVGVLGFGITVLAFYFSTVMDMLSRSTSLIGLGLIFLLGGWELERARRHLVARVKKG